MQIAPLLLTCLPLAPAQDDWALVNNYLLRPKDAAIHDVDGDGVQDLVVVSDVDDLMVWSRGLGSGAFDRFQFICRGMEGPRRLAMIDIEGDGDQDWVVALDGGRDLRLVESLEPGLFSEPRSLDSSSDRVMDVVAGDVDGDGDPDVVAALSGLGLIAWYENTGGGQFGPRQVVATIGGELVDIELMDLNGDGRRDVLWVDRATDAMGFVRQSGPGTFDPPGAIATGLPGTSQVTAGDIDGDGVVEVLLGTPTLIIVYVPEPGGGYAEQSRVSPILLGGASSGLELGDLDGDGILELVSARPGYVIDLLDWNTASRRFIRVPGPASFGARETLLFADVDNDSFLDICAVDTTVSYASGDGNGGFGQQPEIPTDLVTRPGGAFKDIDGDGDLDYFCFADSQQLSPSPRRAVTFIERLGEETFALPVAFEGQSSGGYYSLAFADVNGDGRDDLTYLRLKDDTTWIVEAVMHPRLPSGSLGPATVLIPVHAGFNEEIRAVWIDVDDDGDLDLLVNVPALSPAPGICWYENIGTGKLGAAHPVEAAPGRRFGVFDDFNADGLSDFVSYAQGPRRLRVTYGSASSPSGFLPPKTLLTNVRARSQFAVDVDQDGDPDLVSLYIDTDLRLAYFENVNGSLGRTPTVVDTFAGGIFVSAAVGDRNGDGFEDVLVTTSALVAGTHLFLGNGNGFAPRQPDTLSPEAGSVRTLGLRDANGDADDDLTAGMQALFGFQLRLYENRVEVGTEQCPGQQNSTGQAAELAITGLDQAAKNQMVLTASHLPDSTSIFFLTSQTTGFTPGTGGGQGDLCLGGAIGRYVGPGQVLSSGQEGLARLRLDLTQMPDPTLGLIPATMGQSWSFQGWYRDSNPGVTSNFTAAQTVVLR